MLKLLPVKVLDIRFSVNCVVIFLVLFKFRSYLYCLSFVKLFVLFVDNRKSNGIVRGCFLWIVLVAFFCIQSLFPKSICRNFS